MTDHDPIALYGKRGDAEAPVAFLCSVCKRGDGVFAVVDDAEPAMASARKHCRPECGDCGAALRPGSYCEPCADKRQSQRIEDAWQKAKKVPLLEYPYDFLSAPGLHDELFRDLDHLKCWCLDHERELPEIVFGTEPLELHLDAESILESALSEHHEDAGEDISAAQMAELQAFHDGWCKRTRVVSYIEDHSLGIVLPPEVRDEVRRDIEAAAKREAEPGPGEPSDPAAEREGVDP